MVESCGSVVWNGDNDVVGFLKYYDSETVIAYVPYVNHLVDEGYNICQI